MLCLRLIQHAARLTESIAAAEGEAAAVAAAGGEAATVAAAEGEAAGLWLWLEVRRRLHSRDEYPREPAGVNIGRILSTLNLTLES